MGIENEFNPARFEHFGNSFDVFNFVVNDRRRMIELRFVGDAQHNANVATIEECHPGRRLKKKLHAEYVAIKSDGAVEIFYVDKDLADLIQGRTNRNRSSHCRLLSKAFSYNTVAGVLSTLFWKIDDASNSYQRILDCILLRLWLH